MGYGGTSSTNSDSNSQLKHSVVTSQKGSRKMGLFSWLTNYPAMGCNGILLPTVVLFHLESCLYLYLGKRISCTLGTV